MEKTINYEKRIQNRLERLAGERKEIHELLQNLDSTKNIRLAQKQENLFQAALLHAKKQIQEIKSKQDSITNIPFYIPTDGGEFNQSQQEFNKKMEEKTDGHVPVSEMIKEY